MRINLLTAVALSTASASPPALGLSVPVRPTATYLQAFRDRTAPQRVYTGIENALDPESGITGFTGVDLDALGCQPGDMLSLTTFGGTLYAPSDPDPVGGLRGLTAVFSEDDEVLGRRNRNRVTGAIDVPGLPEFLTEPTANGDRDTDIPEDFLIFTTEVAVAIPAGARFLHFAVIDTFYSDNLAGTPQTHIDIVATHLAVPEPALALLLSGAAAGTALVRRRRG